MTTPRSHRLKQLVLTLAVWAALGTAASAQYRAEAVRGEPFGVGRVEIRLPEGHYSPALGMNGIIVSERNGRVFYPAIEHREVPDLVTDTMKGSDQPILQMLGGMLDQTQSAVVYFLFTGTEPLELTIQTTRVDRVPVRFRSSRHGFEQWYGKWWESYAPRPTLLGPKDDYPPVVQNYMESTIARQFGLQPPPREKGLFSKDLDEQIGVALATEKVKIDFERRRLLGDPALLEAADQPLPMPIPAVSAPVPEVAHDVAVEPMAMRVPVECAYIRFGTFANFLWLQDTLKKWGGDAANLVALRGLDYGMTRRMEQGLVLQQTAMARLFGPTVIEDVAIIGTDLFFQDGGSYGLMFHAKNNLLLGSDFKRQRAERVKAKEDVTDQTVEIAGKKVSLVSSPDGRVRSFYAVEGNFHFVTRSRHLMQRFLETAADEQTSLGGSAAFRHARGLMPIDRQDTVFVYMSEAFFDNLVSPRYRIETRRRLQALADIELTQLAQLIAQAADGENATIESLIASGFLPPEFGVRPDGSQAVLSAAGVVDSLRGRRGAFLPIADIPVENVTPTEAATYRQFVEFYHGNWGNLDPIVVGVQRSKTGKNQEKVVVDARMTPLAQSNFEQMQQTFGPADTLRLAPIAENIASFEAVLTEQRIFGGLQDVNSPLSGGRGGSGLPGGVFRNFLVGYLGAEGPLGPLAILNFGVFSQPDPAGYSKSLLGGWRLSAGNITLFSFQQHVLANVVRQLRYDAVEKPAQVRIDVGDVSRARITPLLNSLAYDRTKETSRGNLRLMHALHQQLGVPLEQCLEKAEQLLDAKLICPLGGQYELRTYPETTETASRGRELRASSRVFGSAPRKSPSGLRWWTSTALDDSTQGGSSAPKGFVAPPLNWFRGLTAQMQVLPDTLAVHAEVVMQLPK